MALACSSGSATPDAGSDAIADAPSDVRTRDGTLSDGTLDGGSERDGPTSVDGGTPTLTELVVSLGSDGSASGALVPDFDPGVHDYYVRCAAGGSSVTASMKASPGALSLLLQPAPASASLPFQTLSLHLDENEALVAAATDGTSTTEYWVRCLPADFPQMKMNRFVEAGAPSPGYYLLGTLVPENQKAYAMVLDGNGVPVWYYLGPGIAMVDVDNVIPGAISFTPGAANFEIFGLDTVNLSYAAPNSPTYVFDIHELRYLPATGHLLVISSPIKSGVDLSGVIIRLADGGLETLGPSSTIQDCSVVEFDPVTGAVAWKWTASDHLDPLKDTTSFELGPDALYLPDGGAVVEVFHCNSIDEDPANGNLLVSARNTDSVFYIDKVSGKILWKLGGRPYTKDNATFVAVADPFYKQHDARLQPGWSAGCHGGTGQISVFDDESYRDAEARGVLYNVVVSADGGATGCDAGPDEGGVPGTVAWQYKGTSNSLILGSFRISADGSHVINWGEGAPRRVFTELDSKANVLLEFQFTDGNISYRAIKVPTSALDLGAMRASAGLSGL